MTVQEWIDILTDSGDPDQEVRMILYDNPDDEDSAEVDLVWGWGLGDLEYGVRIFFHRQEDDAA